MGLFTDSVLFGLARHLDDTSKDRGLGGAQVLFHLISPVTWEPLALGYIVFGSNWGGMAPVAVGASLAVPLIISYVVHFFAAQKRLTFWLLVGFSGLFWLRLGYGYMMPEIKAGLPVAMRLAGAAVIAVIAMRWKYIHMRCLQR